MRGKQPYRVLTTIDTTRALTAHRHSAPRTPHPALRTRHPALRTPHSAPILASMTAGPRASLRRALVVVATLFLFWGLFVLVTGGVGFRYGPLRFSSRGIRNPLLLLLVAVAGAAIAAPPRARVA